MPIGERLTSITDNAPELENDPSAAVGLAQSSLSDDQVVQASQMYSGATAILGQVDQLNGMKREDQDRMWEGMTKAQQQTYVKFGYKPVEYEDKSILRKLTRGAGAALNVIDPVDVLGKALTGAQAASDFMTHGYRFVHETVFDDELDTFGSAWQKWKATTNGERYFDEDDLNKLKSIVGSEDMDLAISLAAGDSPEEYLLKRMDINDPAFTEQIVGLYGKMTQPEVQEAIEFLAQNKISPGRDLASAAGMSRTQVLPSWIPVVGGKTEYEVISGMGDATYRIFADPTLMLGKVNKAYKLGKYAVDPGRVAIEIEMARNLSNVPVGPLQTGTDVMNIPSIASMGQKNADLPMSWKGMKARLGDSSAAHRRAADIIAKRFGESTAGNTQALDQLIREMPGTQRMLGALSHYHQAIPGGIKSADDVFDFYQTAAGITGMLSDRFSRYTFVKDSALVLPKASRFTPLKGAVKGGIDTVIDVGRFGESKLIKGKWNPVRLTAEGIHGMTNLTPKTGYINPYAPDGVELFRQVLAFHLPKKMRGEMIDEFLVGANNFTLKTAVYRNTVEQMARDAGMYETKAGMNLVDKAIRRMNQNYSAFGLDRKLLPGGQEITAGIWPYQMRNAHFVPSFHNWMEAAKDAGPLGQISERALEFTMSKVWKPSVLLRVSFIPRAFGEELIWAAANKGPGAVWRGQLMQLAGVRAGAKKGWDNAIYDPGETLAWLKPANMMANTLSRFAPRSMKTARTTAQNVAARAVGTVTPGQQVERFVRKLNTEYVTSIMTDATRGMAMKMLPQDMRNGINHIMRHQEAVKTSFAEGISARNSQVGDVFTQDTNLSMKLQMKNEDGTFQEVALRQEAYETINPQVEGVFGRDRVAQAGEVYATDPVARLGLDAYRRQLYPQEITDAVAKANELGFAVNNLMDLRRLIPDDMPSSWDNFLNKQGASPEDLANFKQGVVEGNAQAKGAILELEVATTHTTTKYVEHLVAKGIHEAEAKKIIDLATGGDLPLKTRKSLFLRNQAMDRHVAGQELASGRKLIDSTDLPDHMAEDFMDAIDASLSSSVNPNEVLHHGTYVGGDTLRPITYDNAENLYGPGFYTTANPDVASQYAQGKRVSGTLEVVQRDLDEARASLANMEDPNSAFAEWASTRPAKVASEQIDATKLRIRRLEGQLEQAKPVAPAIYRVQWQGNTAPNLIDLEKSLPKNVRDKIDAIMERQGHGRHWADREDVSSAKDYIEELFTNSLDEGTYYGLLDAEKKEVIDALGELGYDGYKHTGGVMTQGVRHDVSIFFDTSKLGVPGTPIDRMAEFEAQLQRFYDDGHEGIDAFIDAARTVGADEVELTKGIDKIYAKWKRQGFDGVIESGGRTWHSLSKPVARSVDEPPEGYMRLYRSASPDAPLKPEGPVFDFEDREQINADWFTDRESIANWYKQAHPGNEVFYVDVPEDIASKWHIGNQDNLDLYDARQFSQDRFTEYYLPREHAENLKPVGTPLDRVELPAIPLGPREAVAQGERKVLDDFYQAMSDGDVAKQRILIRQMMSSRWQRGDMEEIMQKAEMLTSNGRGVQLAQPVPKGMRRVYTVQAPSSTLPANPNLATDPLVQAEGFIPMLSDQATELGADGVKGHAWFTADYNQAKMMADRARGQLGAGNAAVGYLDVTDEVFNKGRAFSQTEAMGGLNEMGDVRQLSSVFIPEHLRADINPMGKDTVRYARLDGKTVKYEQVSEEMDLLRQQLQVHGDQTASELGRLEGSLKEHQRYLTVMDEGGEVTAEGVALDRADVEEAIAHFQTQLHDRGSAITADLTEKETRLAKLQESLNTADPSPGVDLDTLINDLVDKEFQDLENFFSNPLDSTDERDLRGIADEYMTNGKLTRESMLDIPPNWLPQEISVPRYVIADTKNYVQKIVEKGFGWIGQAGDAMVRNPMFIHQYAEALTTVSPILRAMLVDEKLLGNLNKLSTKFGMNNDDAIRAWMSLDDEVRFAKNPLAAVDMEDLDSVEIIEKFKGITPNEAARLNKAAEHMQYVDQHISNVTMERATNAFIPFLDDHRLRSQFQEKHRYMFPFQFAEEQFIKRWARTLTKDPTLIRKAALTMEGFRASGIITQNEYGEDVYVFPGGSWMQKAVGKMVSTLTGNPAMLPFSSPMTGSVKYAFAGGDTLERMGLPSQGPLMGFSLSMVHRFMPEVAQNKYVQQFEGIAYGERGMTRTVADTVFPSSIKKIWDAVVHDPEDDLKMSAYMKQAAAYMESAGLAPANDAGDEEKKIYLSRLRNAARTMGLLSATLGSVAPSALTGNMPLNLAPEFKALMSTMPMEEAVDVFLAKYPDGAPWTVFDSKNISGAPIQYTHATFKVMDEHAGFFARHKDAGPWFLPQTNDDDIFNRKTYHETFANEMRQRKTFEEYQRDMWFAEAADEYFDTRDGFYQAQAEMKGNKAATANNEKMWSDWKEEYFHANPTFQEDLTGNEAKNRRRRILNNFDDTINDPDAPATPHTGYLVSLVKTFRDMEASNDSYGTKNSRAVNAAKNQNKQDFALWAVEFTKQHREAQAFFNSVIRPELGDLDIEGM